MKIEIFGIGCTSCDETERRVKASLKFLSLEAEIKRIDDQNEIGRKQVVLLPALAINGAIKCSGRIPEVRELHTWITTAALEEEKIKTN